MRKACDGEPTLECGDFQECIECGIQVRFDMVDDSFWGFQTCREKTPSRNAEAGSSEESRTVGAHTSSSSSRLTPEGQE